MPIYITQYDSVKNISELYINTRNLYKYNDNVLILNAITIVFKVSVQKLELSCASHL